MTVETEMKLMKLYRGSTLRHVRKMMELAQVRIAERQLELRHKICGLNIGE